MSRATADGSDLTRPVNLVGGNLEVTVEKFIRGWNKNIRLILLSLLIACFNMSASAS